MQGFSKYAFLDPSIFPGMQGIKGMVDCLISFFFFNFFCFPIYNVYPKYCQRYKKMSVNGLRNFIFENHFKRIEFLKEKVIIQ